MVPQTGAPKKLVQSKKNMSLIDQNRLGAGGSRKVARSGAALLVGVGGSSP